MQTVAASRHRIPFSPKAEDTPSAPPRADLLQWPGATEEQLAFMRRVYERHVSRSSSRRRFVPSVPRDELEVVEHGQLLRTAAARSCRALLAEARAALVQEQSEGKPAARDVKEIGARSGYRSVETQFAGWQGSFRTKYYQDTQAKRESLAGGAHSDTAVDFMAGYVAGRIAAPGFSRHNDGTAMDFFTRTGGGTLGPDTGAKSVAAWKESWLFRWLSQRAQEFQFFQNTAIVEPWHWEHRARTASEAAIAAGRLEIRNAPPLASHIGSQPDLILRWNGMPTIPEKVDVVVHLHGFSKHDAAMRLDADKEPSSGLDFDDPKNPGSGRGRRRQTLGILPRGSHVRGTKYEFPALVARSGFDALIDYALQQFATAIGAPAVSRDRLIVTAHSGGGKALVELVGFADPDEVHVFDALYWSAAPLVKWVRGRIAKDAAAAGAGAALSDAGALRVLFLEPPPGKTWTRPESLAVHRALRRALKQVGAVGNLLESRYRVERTTVSHPDLPQTYGWRLLEDAGANVPRAKGLVLASIGGPASGP